MTRTLVDGRRLAEDLEALAQYSDVPGPAVTRIVFSPADLKARGWLRGRCSDARLHLREDAVGNLFARWKGSEPDLPAVGTGSHIDAIPNSGRYDGTVGVVGGLEAIRSLQEARFEPRRSIELLMFTSEEPTRFGLGCLGSRLLSKSLDAEEADKLRDGEDHSLLFMRKRGGFTGPLADVALSGAHFAAFIELHIEQGPHLERERIAIGAVESIAAPATLRVTIKGDGGHAGAVLMAGRRDALLGAAELALAVEAAALGTGSIDSVGTTGVCQVFPGAVNSIPSKATLEIDVRDTDLARRDETLQGITDAAATIAMKRKLSMTVKVLNADAPASCDEKLVEAIEASCRRLEIRSRRMVSRAYHDSLFMSRICPVSMIFIPCRNGYSHRPDEYATPEAVQAGVAVLAETLRALAS